MVAQLDAVNAVYTLSAFSETERKTLRLLAEYLRYRRENSEPDKPMPRCFTYKGLRWYYNKTRAYRHLEWHTVERNIRRLAENKWLARRIFGTPRGGKTALFCLTSNLEYVLAKLGWL